MGGFPLTKSAKQAAKNRELTEKTDAIKEVEDEQKPTADVNSAEEKEDTGKDGREDNAD